MNIEIVADFACQCAERPVWDPDSFRVYFTDNETTHLFCYDSGSGTAKKVYDGDHVVGAMTLHEDGRLLLLMGGGRIALWSPQSGELEVLLDAIEGEESSRFNDCVADPEGRVFCGTMPDGDRPGRFYRWDPDGSLHVLLEEAGMPNGMGFSPDLRWFYLTDTNARKITRYRYHRKSGELDEARTLITFPEEGGSPDGMTIDSEGCLWSALYGGACLVRLSPDGEELSRIEVPMAQNPTCPVFAGEGSDVMFVTTAGGTDRQNNGRAAGTLLRLRAPSRGQAQFRSR